MINRLPLFFAVSLSLYSSAAAQTTNENTAQNTPIAVRGWVFPESTQESLLLGINLGESLGFSKLTETKEGAVSSRPGYTMVEEKEAQLELRSGDKVLASGNVVFRAGSFYTVAAWIRDGDWQIKVFNDGPTSGANATRPLRVFNFAGERKAVVSLGSLQAPVDAASVAQLEAKPNISMVTVRVLGADGSHPAISSVEVDFSAVPSAYVVIGPDYRGRMRPRIIEGGLTTDEVPQEQEAEQGTDSPVPGA